MPSFEDVKHRAVHKAADLLNRTRSSPKAAAAAAAALVNGYPPPSYQIQWDQHDSLPQSTSLSSSPPSSSSSAVSSKPTPRGPRPLLPPSKNGGASPPSLSPTTNTAADALNGGAKNGDVEADSAGASPTDDNTKTMQSNAHASFAPAPTLKPKIGEHHTPPVSVEVAPQSSSPPRPPTHRVGPSGAGVPVHPGPFGTNTMPTTTTSTLSLYSHPRRQRPAPSTTATTTTTTPHDWIIPPLASAPRPRPRAPPLEAKRTNTKREGGVAGGVVRGRGEGGGCKGQGTLVSHRSIWDAPGSPVQYSPTEEEAAAAAAGGGDKGPERRAFQQYRRQSQPEPCRPLVQHLYHNQNQSQYQHQQQLRLQRRQDSRSQQQQQQQQQQRNIRPGSSGTALPQLAICSTPRRRRDSHVSPPLAAVASATLTASVSQEEGVEAGLVSQVAEPGLVPRPLQLSPKGQSRRGQDQQYRSQSQSQNQHGSDDARVVASPTSASTGAKLVKVPENLQDTPEGVVNGTHPSTHEHSHSSQEGQRIEWTSVPTAMRASGSDIPLRPRNPVPRALTYGAEHIPARRLTLTYGEGEEGGGGMPVSTRLLALTNGEEETTMTTPPRLPSKELALITTKANVDHHRNDTPPDYSPTDPAKQQQHHQRHQHQSQQPKTPTSPTLTNKPLPLAPHDNPHPNHHRTQQQQHQENPPPPYPIPRMPARKPLPATVSTPEMEEKGGVAAGCQWEAVALRSGGSGSAEPSLVERMERAVERAVLEKETTGRPTCLVRKPVAVSADRDASPNMRAFFL